MTQYRENENIFAEKVRQLYSHAPIGLIATLINGLILFFILRGVISRTRLLYWLGAIIVLLLLRSVIVYRYRFSTHGPEDARYWNNWFNISMALSGAVWGLSGIFLFSTESIAHQVFLAFVLGGMVAGAAGTFAANLMTFTVFTLTALVPIIIRFFLLWDDIHIAMGSMAVLFGVLTFFTAKRVNESNHQSFQLKYENEDLVRNLQQAKARVESYNEELRQEIEERKKIEDELKNHKENLEVLVQERTNELSKANVELEKEIAERIEAQKALRESEEEYRLLVDNANDAIVILQDEIIKFANQAACTSSGYAREELIGKPFRSLIHEEDAGAMIERYGQRIEGSSVPQMYTIRIYSKEGDEIWAQNNAVLIEWEGRPAVLNILRDITLLRKLEDQLHHRNKMEAIGTLAGGIAHDFNNILSIISGNVELALLDLPPDNPGRSCIDNVLKAVQRAKGIVNQILSFSRRGESRKMPIDIRATVEEALMLLRASLPVSIKITKDIDRIKETVIADSTEIHQLVMNLFTNAADAMEDETGEIIIQMKKIELSLDDLQKYPDLTQGCYVRLSVRDTGRGMDRATMERIFEPYFTTKRPGKGTGMGLAQCYGIVKGNKGAIQVDSEVGKGSAFEILLPCHGGAVSSPPGDRHQFSTGKGERVLFIDDEEGVAYVGGSMLERMGYNVVTETDPEKAFNLFKEEPKTFDLVITDMTMPGINGIQLIEKLRALRPDIPVIISSGHSDLISRADLKRMGHAAFLQKPYTMETLSKAIDEILGSKSDH